MEFSVASCIKLHANRKLNIIRFMLNNSTKSHRESESSFLPLGSVFLSIKRLWWWYQVLLCNEMISEIVT